MSIHREKAATLLKKCISRKKSPSWYRSGLRFMTSRPSPSAKRFLRIITCRIPWKPLWSSCVGQLTRPYGTIANDPQKQVKVINKIQRHLVENTRLGIPAMIHEECLSGVMSVGATAFPCSLNYGSAWDTELMKKIGMAIGDELRSDGCSPRLVAGSRRLPGCPLGGAWKRRSAKTPISSAKWRSPTSTVSKGRTVSRSPR